MCQRDKELRETRRLLLGLWGCKGMFCLRLEGEGQDLEVRFPPFSHPLARSQRKEKCVCTFLGYCLTAATSTPPLIE